jgi:hypothetical protein
MRVCSCLLVKWSFFIIDFRSFFHCFMHSVGPPPSINPSLSHCICGQPLDPMQFHLSSCAHGSEKMISHDVMWNAFAIDERFHVLYE